MGEVLSLWREVTEVPHRQHRSHHQHPSMNPGVSQQEMNTRRAKQTAQAGHYGKAVQALASEGLAPPSAETFQEMLSKHLLGRTECRGQEIAPLRWLAWRQVGPGAEPHWKDFTAC